MRVRCAGEDRQSALPQSLEQPEADHHPEIHQEVAAKRHVAPGALEPPEQQCRRDDQDDAEAERLGPEGVEVIDRDERGGHAHAQQRAAGGAMEPQVLGHGATPERCVL